MIAAGIDAGSRTLKIVVMEATSRRVLASGCRDQVVDQARLAEDLLAQCLRQAGIGQQQLARVVATGYGRHLMDRAQTTVTEITCLARGVRHQAPQVRTIVDIGGQDSKVIFLDDVGVRDFAMNDRCAAGTGQFLEVVARQLGLSLPELAQQARRSEQPAAISSMCAVFAETEIVSLLANGTAPADIVAGVLHSVASRVASLGAHAGLEPVIFSGGVALIDGMDHILAKALGNAVIRAAEPQLCAALGAALTACETLAMAAPNAVSL